MAFGTVFLFVLHCVRGHSMSRRFIFPMKVMGWETLKTANGESIEASEKMNAVGFIPVYDSIQGLVDDHGNQIATGTFEEKHDTERADSKLKHGGRSS